MRALHLAHRERHRGRYKRVWGMGVGIGVCLESTRCHGRDQQKHARFADTVVMDAVQEQEIAVQQHQRTEAALEAAHVQAQVANAAAQELEAQHRALQQITSSEQALHAVGRQHDVEMAQRQSADLEAQLKIA